MNKKSGSERVFNDNPGFSGFLTRNRKAIIIFSVCILIAYGLKLFNVTIGKDTEAIISIPDSLYNSWISLNRFGLVYLKKILGIYQFNPYFAMIMSFFCMILGSCVWQYLFFRLTPFRNGFAKRSWIFPAVCFTSPLMASQLGFLLQTFEVSLAFIVCAISLLLIWQFIDDGKIWKAVLSLLLLAGAFSVYQGLVPLYIFGAAATFILYAQEHQKVLRPIIILIVNMVLALLLYMGADRFVHAYTGVATDPYINDMVLWRTTSEGECIKQILGHVKHAFTMSVSYYTFAFPAAVIAGIASIAALLHGRKKNRVITVLAMIILFASPFLMSILNGQEAYYRTQFVQPYMCGFVLQLFTAVMWRSLKKTAKAAGIIACIISAVCVFQQLVVTTRMYYTEYVSLKEDEMLALKISMRIDELDLGESPSEPLVMIGAHQGRLNPSASMEWDFEGHSFFSWYYTQAAGNAIAINFMDTLGYHYQVPTVGQVEQAEKIAADLPVWPDSGCIVHRDGMIIIHMS